MERRQSWDGIIIVTQFYVHNNEEVRNLSAQLAERIQDHLIIMHIKLCNYYSPIPTLSPFLFTPSLYVAILNVQDFSFTSLLSFLMP